MGAIAPKYSSIDSKCESSIESGVWQTYVRRVERGDVIAIPKGVTFWWYNDGDEQHRVLCVEDTNLGVYQQYGVQVNQICSLTYIIHFYVYHNLYCNTHFLLKCKCED